MLERALSERRRTSDVQLLVCPPTHEAQFVMRCGVENAIETVEELEKCEYQFTGTSPALCLPLEQTETVPVTDKLDAGRDEL
jgi:hypothetical protein